MFGSRNTAWQLGDFVIITLTEESGEIIAFESGLFAVAHDDTADITWHGSDELEPLP